MDDIWYGFDADAAGDHAATSLMDYHPQIRRLRLTGGKDWNEHLQHHRNANGWQHPQHAIMPAGTKLICDTKTTGKGTGRSQAEIG